MYIYTYTIYTCDFFKLQTLGFSLFLSNNIVVDISNFRKFQLSNWLLSSINCKVITIILGKVLILSKLFILSCCITQVNEGMAANSRIVSNTGHTVLQRAEHTAWKNELVGKMNLFSPVFQNETQQSNQNFLQVYYQNRNPIPSCLTP